MNWNLIIYLADVRVSTDNVLNEIDLTKVKVLKIHFVTDKVVDNMLSRCNSLETLKIGIMIREGLNNRQPSLPSLKAFWKRNQKLKNLKLGSDFNELFFNEDTSDVVRFQLTHLYFTDERRLMLEHIDRNFIKFLATQSHCLEWICFDDVNVIENIVRKISGKIFFKTSPDLRTRDQQLEVNENLNFPHNRTAEDFKDIIGFLPRLERFHIKELAPESMAVISNKFPALKKLLFLEHEFCISGPI